MHADKATPSIIRTAVAETGYETAQYHGNIRMVFGDHCPKVLCIAGGVWLGCWKWERAEGCPLTRLFAVLSRGIHGPVHDDLLESFEVEDHELRLLRKKRLLMERLEERARERPGNEGGDLGSGPQVLQPYPLGVDALANVQ